MADGPRPTTRVVVAITGATVVVAAELAALVLSTRLSVATVEGAVPASVPAVPVLGVSAAAVGLALAVHSRLGEGARLTGSGAALVVAAPVTAFGGGCAHVSEGVALFRSGVRIGVAVGPCVTYLNGALLVLGYGLLAAGLWLAVEGIGLPAVGTPRFSLSD